MAVVIDKVNKIHVEIHSEDKCHTILGKSLDFFRVKKQRKRRGGFSYI